MGAPAPPACPDIAGSWRATRQDAPCTGSDPNGNCFWWERDGECSKNPGFMLNSCRFSCGCKVTDGVATVTQQGCSWTGSFDGVLNLVVHTGLTISGTFVSPEKVGDHWSVNVTVTPSGDSFIGDFKDADTIDLKDGTTWNRKLTPTPTPSPTV